ncbi:MAG: type 3 dihydrofolate reductase [Gammaproteobacteria bacterium]|nr:type 3 dihydrofolate reductase [Gammaproteobacteria bacterium]
MLVSIIVAAAQNNVIGRGNDLPWRLPDDLKRFKALTLGKPVIMGRKTYVSIGRPLPQRHNIVISRQPGLTLPDCTVVSSLDAALAAAGDAAEAMVIGGAEIFAQVLPRTDRIYLTRVHANVEGDTFFPELVSEDWIELDSEYHPADDRHAFPFTFLQLRRAHIV